MRITTRFVFVILIANFTSAVIGQTLLERFDRLDPNQDGQITKLEARDAAWFSKGIRQFDANENGILERTELQRGLTTTSDANSQRLKTPPVPPHHARLDRHYHEVPGVDQNLLNLDLYIPKDKNKRRPVMIMIHGGGWQTGDKSNRPIVGAKKSHFLEQGYIYASINYRLTSRTSTEPSVVHPIHVKDCAKAIAWIHSNIARFGGDPAQLHLMGHSSGGHLAGLLATNEKFLKAEGKNSSILKTNVLLDPAALDISRYVELARGRKMTETYQRIFGEDPARWKDASPSLHVQKGTQIPPTLIFYTGNRMALNQLAPDFSRSLRQAGTPARAVDTVRLSHAQINSNIGMIGDPMTQLIDRLHAGEDASGFPDTIKSIASSIENEPRAK